MSTRFFRDQKILERLRTASRFVKSGVPVETALKNSLLTPGDQHRCREMADAGEEPWSDLWEGIHATHLTNVSESFAFMRERLPSATLGDLVKHTKLLDSSFSDTAKIELRAEIQSDDEIADKVATLAIAMDPSHPAFARIVHHIDLLRSTGELPTLTADTDLPLLEAEIED